MKKVLKLFFYTSIFIGALYIVLSANKRVNQQERINNNSNYSLIKYSESYSDRIIRTYSSKAECYSAKKEMLNSMVRMSNNVTHLSDELHQKSEYNYSLMCEKRYRRAD